MKYIIIRIYIIIIIIIIVIITIIYIYIIIICIDIYIYICTLYYTLYNIISCPIVLHFIILHNVKISYIMCIYI